MMLSAGIEHWPFKRPFHTSGHTFDGIDVLLVTAEQDDERGQGEAVGVYYRGETAAGMAEEIGRLAEAGNPLSRDNLPWVMAAGGARNALDCAFWDLEAKLKKQPVWKLAGLTEVRPLLTTFTLGAESPGAMASAAFLLPQARAIKLKLLGDGGDSERVAAVRLARPDVWLGVDANEGLTPSSYDEILPTLVEARVGLLEQPFPANRDHYLDGLDSPIPIAADESVQDSSDLERMQGRCQVINIKLDKCGGLTAALSMAAAARRMGFRLMVGNMVGTSLATAPAFLLGQLCEFVDLDGPTFLSHDRTPSVTYQDGLVSCPAGLWG
jgi:L-Ala-D/L-Glu epimerase / N-acetyl-D-glutamate racemase